MKFSEAMPQLVGTTQLRRASWQRGRNIRLSLYEKGPRLYSHEIDEGSNEIFQWLSIADIFADDWEVIQPPYWPARMKADEQ